MNKLQNPEEITRLEQQLDHFDARIRSKALLELVQLAGTGMIELPEEREIANLHCHTFYSYNGYGFSPSHIAWLGRKLGAKFMGIIDFDVLDGVDEFLEACEIVGLRGTAGIETRVFIPEFSQMEINSPGEPGVCYHMGTGFTSSKVPKTAAPALQDIRHRITLRNQQILERVNDFLAPLSLDYDEDIVPLTPAGNVTERHMVQKIAEKSFDVLMDPDQFWREKLNLPQEKLQEILKDRNAFNNVLRSKLMKRGGVGYIQPDETTFPTIDEYHAIIHAANALPCSAWLDGTSAGEQAIETLLDLLISKGVTVLNIIPDRNWNIPDPEIKARKVKALYRVVELAQSLDLPILVGTEMNAYGQKLVDDFDSPALAPLKDIFIEGAYFLYGHTWMERYYGMGYQSDWSHQNFPNQKSKNTFFKAAGRLADPQKNKELSSISINSTLNPQQVINVLEDIQGNNKINEA
jgi:hypothetical protein